MGLWSKIKKKAKKAWKKVKNTVKKVVRVVKEVVNRALGILDFVGSLLGIRPRKYLRLKVIILRKDGSPVQKQAHVKTWIEETIKIFDERLNVEVRKPNLNLDFIDVMSEDAPDYALHPPNSTFSAPFSDAADYFEEHADHPRTGTGSFLGDYLGYGEPVYAFVVDQIQNGKLGSVYWALPNFCVLSKTAPKTTMAHEIGHVCGLLHSRAPRNLMNSDRDKDKDSKLNRWQISVVRNSRFVVFTPRRG